MSLAEFLERLEADQFDEKLFELVKNGFNIVSRKPKLKEDELCNS